VKSERPRRWRRFGSRWQWVDDVRLVNGVRRAPGGKWAKPAL
jgi:hypothetical protein